MVALSFYADATSAELIPDDGGWFVSFVRPSANKCQFFTKDDVCDDLGPRALKNQGNVIRYFESRLKAAGYIGVTRRTRATGVEVAAVWDFHLVGGLPPH